MTITESATFKSSDNASNHPFIDPMDFHKCIKKLRAFFETKKGFCEVPTQSRLSSM